MKRPRRPLFENRTSDVPDHGHAVPDDADPRGLICECGQKCRGLEVWRNHVTGASGADDPVLERGQLICWREANGLGWESGRFIGYRGYSIVVQLLGGEEKVRPPSGHRLGPPPSGLVDLGDLSKCPVAAVCESCEHRKTLRVTTFATAVGVICLTMCARCLLARAFPPIGHGDAARLVALHSLHCGGGTDTMSPPHTNAHVYNLERTSR
jgi:hypothetical protein